MARAGKYPDLSREQEAELSRRMHKGDDSARQTLVLSNLRLVASIAKQYRCDGVPFMDLIQEGNMGLTIAAAKYHYAFRTRFSTYACMWIREYIRRYLVMRVPMIELPVRKSALLGRIREAERCLRQEGLHDPSAADIARALHLPAAAVEHALLHECRVVSLDAEAEGGSGTPLREFIADTYYAPEKRALESAGKAAVRRMVSRLPAAERRVITLRYSLDDGGIQRSLRDTGAILGITGEAARQVEARALTRLKRLCRRRGITPKTLIA